MVGAMSIDDYGLNVAYLSNFLKKTFQEAIRINRMSLISATERRSLVYRSVRMMTFSSTNPATGGLAWPSGRVSIRTPRVRAATSEDFVSTS